MTLDAPDITIHRINQILKTVFELLWFEPQGLYVSEIIDYLKGAIPFTEYENGVYPFAPDMPRYEAIVRIGTIPFEKAGWLEKTKYGRWYITLAGRTACHQFKDSVKFFELSAQVFEEWKTKENKRLSILEKDKYSNIVEYSWQQIKQYFEALDIRDIRVIVISLLKALGCHIIWTGQIKDDGSSVDLICSTDPLGIKSPRMVIHITKYSHVTTIESVNFFSNDLNPNDIGIYFSFGGFANGLKEYSFGLKQPLIRLIDLERFVDLWIDNIKKVDQVGYSKFPIRPIHFLSLSNEGAREIKYPNINSEQTDPGNSIREEN